MTNPLLGINPHVLGCVIKKGGVKWCGGGTEGLWEGEGGGSLFVHV